MNSYHHHQPAAIVQNIQKPQKKHKIQLLLSRETDAAGNWYKYIQWILLLLYYLIHSFMQIEDFKTPRLIFVWADTWEGK